MTNSMTKLCFPLTVTFFLIPDGFKTPKVIMMIVVGGENPPTFWKEFNWMGPACDDLVRFLKDDEEPQLSQESLPTVEGPKVVIEISPEFSGFMLPPNVLCVVVEDENNYALFTEFSEVIGSLRRKLVSNMFGFSKVPS